MRKLAYAMVVIFSWTCTWDLDHCFWVQLNIFCKILINCNCIFSRFISLQLWIFIYIYIHILYSFSLYILFINYFGICFQTFITNDYLLFISIIICSSFM